MRQSKAKGTGEGMERIMRSSRHLLVARLAAAAAHEIINPISAVVNLASLVQSELKDNCLTAQQGADARVWLSQAISEAGRAGRIASELLAFARAAGRGPAPADFNGIVRQTFSLAAPLLKTEDVESRLDLGDDLPWIPCDSAEVQLALLHLIVNAVEAAEGRGRKQVTIDTRAGEDGRTLLVEVQDSGDGIAPEHRNRIFDPFFTTKKRAENLGIGLTVARNIMEAHGGTITVESRPGQATSVTLAFPVDRQEEDK